MAIANNILIVLYISAGSMGLEPRQPARPRMTKQFRLALIGRTACHKLRSIRSVAPAIHDSAVCALRKTKTFNF
jgi:hypothetical protein